MLQEMRGFAQAATFDSPSRDTARSALEQFASTAEQVAGQDANLSRAATALEQVQSLHATLRAAGGQRSKTSSARALLEHGVEHMQKAVQTQLLTLGIYKHHSAQSQNRSRSWSAMRVRRADMLVELDKVWWRLRGELDDYLEQAEKQVVAFRGAFSALAEYRQCSAGFSDLQTKYDDALRIRSSSHEKLHKTWRASTNLLGQLASTIVDGEAFATFYAEEGCDSPLATQTLQQAKSAVGGMRMLIHRFEAGGLPRPDLESLAESIKRIQESFDQANSGCKSTKQTAGASSTKQTARRVHRN